MKKLILGRNDLCDIIIPDTTDMVSRKQAVLTISFGGKMVLYDTSNNGTYLNGERIENGKGKRVTRKDKVNFAHVADLDWNTVYDPYKKLKGMLVLLLLLLCLAGGATTWWYTQQKTSIHSKNDKKIEQKDDKGKTQTTVEPSTIPQSNEQPSQTSYKKKKKKKTQEDKPVSEVNEKTPIIN